VYKLDTCGSIERRSWPDAAPIKIDALKDSFSVLPRDEGLVRRPDDLKRKPAVIRGCKGEPETRIGLKADLKAHRVPLILRNRKCLIGVEQLLNSDDLIS
jgi:hypothetical protein